MGQLDPGDPRPPYVQIAADLRAKIQAGRWHPGEKLPSNLALTKEYGVVPETVRRALRVLIDQGLIATQSTRGTFVLRDAPEPSPEIAELRAEIAELRAHLMSLYHTVGQPYPYEEGAAGGGQEVLDASR